MNCLQLVFVTCVYMNRTDVFCFQCDVEYDLFCVYGFSIRG